jgi:glutamate synthase (NADPH/NADH) small chain
MSQPKVTTQAAEKRIGNFNEVVLGFSKRLSSEEARRCPQCADPGCIEGCPLGIDIPGFIRLLREGKLTAAYEKIKEKNVLPSVCGRICSAQCEVKCVLNREKAPIAIRALESYVADFGRSKFFKKTPQDLRGQPVAVVGAGPAGLVAAAELAKKGYKPVVFEALNKPGGVLRYGVPDFRISKKVLDGEINEIKALGVDIKTNFYVGQTATIDELLQQGFGAVLLATGAGIPRLLDIPGMNLGGVYYGEEFLMRVNLMKGGIFSRYIPTFHIGERVVVIGSGNTALDCARSAVRFGRDVTLMFRRTEDDMRVHPQERTYGKEEGVRLEPLVRPVEILASRTNTVRGLKCIRMDYADLHDNGTWEMVPLPHSEFVMDVDTVIIAIGHQPNSYLTRSHPSLKTQENQTITVDPETSMTTLKGVFAAGNAVTNAGPVINAILGGKKVAERIDHYLQGSAS